MKSRILIALLLATTSGGLLAQTAASGGETGVVTGTEDTAPNPKRTQHPASTEPRKGSPRTESSSRNSHPRWHSFLPGMFR